MPVGVFQSSLQSHTATSREDLSASAQIWREFIRAVRDIFSFGGTTWRKEVTSKTAPYVYNVTVFQHMLCRGCAVDTWHCGPMKYRVLWTREWTNGATKLATAKMTNNQNFDISLQTLHTDRNWAFGLLSPRLRHCTEQTVLFWAFLILLVVMFKLSVPGRYTFFLKLHFYARISVSFQGMHFYVTL